MWFHSEYEKFFRGILPPAIASDAKCPHCQKPYSVGDYFNSALNPTQYFYKQGLGNYMTEVCAKCRDKTRIVDFSLNKNFQYDDSLQYDKSAIRKQIWYHATFTDNWDKKFGEDFTLLHCGDFATAMTRVAYLCNASGDYLKAHIFSLRLLPYSRVTDPVEDIDCWFVENLPGSKAVSPYVNKFEMPGSISLYGRTSSFEIIGKEDISMDGFICDFTDIRESELNFYK